MTNLVNSEVKTLGLVELTEEQLIDIEGQGVSGAVVGALLGMTTGALQYGISSAKNGGGTAAGAVGAIWQGAFWGAVSGALTPTP